MIHHGRHRMISRPWFWLLLLFVCTWYQANVIHRDFSRPSQSLSVIYSPSDVLAKTAATTFTRDSLPVSIFPLSLSYPIRPIVDRPPRRCIDSTLLLLSAPVVCLASFLPRPPPRS